MRDLITAEELNEMLNQPGLKVFDIRGRWGDPPTHHRESYLEGHIPGAFYLNWLDLLEPGVPIPEAPVAGKEQAERVFQELGIESGDLVVLYDEGPHMFASRVWWSMKYWGLANVKLLNGGWSNWKTQGLPVCSKEETPKSGSYRPSASASWLIETQDVVAQKDQCLLLDARGEASFKSKRIPGSVSLPFRTLLDSETGLFKDKSEMEKVFDEAGDWRNRPIISTCGAGYTASVVLFALRQLDRPVPLYDGSLAIWLKEGHPSERDES